MENIKNLLNVGGESLSKFCQILNIQYDEKLLKGIQKDLKEGEVHLFGLKQFAYLQEELDIGDHKSLIDELKSAIDSEKSMTLDQYLSRQYDFPTYSCEDFLYHLSSVPMVYRLVRDKFKKQRDEGNAPKTQAELNDGIENCINSLKEHFMKLANYGQANDTLVILDIKQFWKTTPELESIKRQSQ